MYSQMLITTISSYLFCQVSSVKITRRLYGAARRILRMAPLHHHFELCGVKEPIIVASAYFISFIFALCAGYIGLISV